MPKKDERKSVGRPRSIPAGARPRAIRLTDGEYRAVVEFVKGLRAGSVEWRKSGIRPRKK